MGSGQLSPCFQVLSGLATPGNFTLVLATSFRSRVAAGWSCPLQLDYLPIHIKRNCDFLFFSGCLLFVYAQNLSWCWQ